MQIFHLPTDWEGLIVRSQPIEGKSKQYNIDVFQNNSIVMTLRDVEFIEAPNVDGKKDFWTPTPDVVIARSQENLQVVPPTDTAKLIERGNHKRRSDRLAGRSAIYKILRSEQLSHTVSQESNGRPFLKGSDMGISISHCNQMGWAGLYRKGLIGLDAERIATRSKSFQKHWFTEGEQVLIGQSDLLETIVWTCKEAVSKLLGCGFSIHPKSFEIINIEPEQCIAYVQLSNEAFSLGEMINAPNVLTCQWMQVDSEIVTFVTLTPLKGQVAC